MQNHVRKSKSQYVGMIVDVRFIKIKSGSGVGAVSHEFKKLALIDKFHPTPLRPNVGEYWKCRVHSDTKPEELRRGVLFIEPLERLEEEIDWKVIDEPGTNVLGCYKPAVVRRVTIGKLVVDETVWSPVPVEHLRSNWPTYVRQVVVRRLNDYARAERKFARLKRRAELVKLKENVQVERDPETGNARFQWTGNWLTNGEIWLPRQYPTRSEWRQYAIPRVPERYWETFLNCLCGKYLDEIIPIQRSVMSCCRSAQPALTARQRRTAAILSGRMWEGDGHSQTISIGANLIFTVKCSDDRSLFVVDNPGVGAIYVFANYEDARSLAAGQTPRRQAIKDGAMRIYHRKGWEQRLTALIGKHKA